MPTATTSMTADTLYLKWVLPELLNVDSSGYPDADITLQIAKLKILPQYQ